MMDRRAFLGTLAVLAAPVAAGGQQAAKRAHIGVLILPPRAGAGGTYIGALREGLQALGYVDGENLLLEIRWAEGRPELLPGLAAELLSSRPDVLVASGSGAILPSSGQRTWSLSSWLQ